MYLYMQQDVLNKFNSHSKEAVERFKEEIRSIRTGRATPGLVENIVVETYGGQTKLKLLELASITTEGNAILVIQPFDPSTVSDINKAILQSPLSMVPQINGSQIKINIPPLSEEQRLKMIKMVGQMIEEKRNIIRNYRDESRKNIKNKFQAKEVTEDEKYRLEKELDEDSKKYFDEINDLREKKEKEIKEV